MKINVNENNVLEITEVYNSILLKTNDNEKMYISMRDSGFEINYEGQWYSLKEGIVKKIK